MVVVGIEISTFGAMVGGFDKETEELAGYMAEIRQKSSSKANASRTPRRRGGREGSSLGH